MCDRCTVLEAAIRELVQVLPYTGVFVINGKCRQPGWMDKHRPATVAALALLAKDAGEGGE